MSHDLRFYFNRRNQWCDVYLHDVHPNTFDRHKGGKWGYFLPVWIDYRRGRFGEIHLVKRRIRIDTIVHELDHLRTEWMWARGTTITRHNEEKMADFLDGLVRAFIRELKKVEPDIKL